MFVTVLLVLAVIAFGAAVVIDPIRVRFLAGGLFCWALADLVRRL